MPFSKPTTAKLKEVLLKKYNENSIRDILFRSILEVDKFKDIEYVLRATEEIFNFSKTYGHEYFEFLIRKYGNHQMTGFSGNGRTYNQIIDGLKEIHELIQDEVFENYRLIVMISFFNMLLLHKILGDWVLSKYILHNQSKQEILKE